LFVLAILLIIVIGLAMLFGIACLMLRGEAGDLAFVGMIITAVLALSGGLALSICELASR
jgi:hypothetical protein